MRRWLPIVLIALAILWFILTNVGAGMAVGDLTARPISALMRDGAAIPVQPSGRAPHKARHAASAGVA